ncbi:MAG: hypothetical protein HQL19_05010 [Candidatus Omnitrophica bacterium]|nr:hypothetical protein [Candidatus Omnitrophota bacterium]
MDKDKKDFIIKRGVLGTGLPVGILMALTMAMQEPGFLFRLQGFHLKTFVFSLCIFLPLFLIAGYFWGLIVYKHTRKHP